MDTMSKLNRLVMMRVTARYNYRTTGLSSGNSHDRMMIRDTQRSSHSQGGGLITIVESVA